GDLVDGRNGCGGAADFHSELAGVSAKSVTVDLNFVVVVLVASVWQNFQDLRAVGEGVRRERSPAIREKCADVYRAAGGACGRRGLDLRCAGALDGCSLRAELNCRAAFEICAGNDGDSATRIRPGRRLRHGGTREARRGLRRRPAIETCTCPEKPFFG